MLSEADPTQGYGYVEASDCYAVVEQYRQAGIPLDGLHIDVDLQVGILKAIHKVVANQEAGQLPNLHHQ